jgi:hypothetical protein
VHPTELCEEGTSTAIEETKGPQGVSEDCSINQALLKEYAMALEDEGNENPALEN